MCEQFEGLGVPEAMLTPGTAVMVAAGAISAMVNGGSPLICYARVLGPATERDTEQFKGGRWWWLNVYLGAPEPLPQMYRTDQILGVPAAGLTPTQ